MLTSHNLFSIIKCIELHITYYILFIYLFIFTQYAYVDVYRLHSEDGIVFSSVCLCVCLSVCLSTL